MKNTPSINIILFIGMILLSGSSRSQTINMISAPEAALAEILLKDTTSQTVSYLPKGYWFGLTDRSHGWAVLVKNGPKNYLLRDGTHHVYLLGKQNGKIHLERIDSSAFSGDNFLMMAFLRNDTIYQYGGYGFWNTRDFFMRFRPTNRDWEFLTGGNGLKNELNYHWYDQHEDAFYVIGSLSSMHHPVPKKILVDSIYRYPFATKQWTAIGRLPDNFSELNPLSKLELPVCFTPFGFLDTRTFQVKLYDLPGNKIFSPKGRLTDFLLRIAKGNPIQTNEYKHFIYLADTLHIFQGTKDKVYHDRISISEADFDTLNCQTFYVPIKQGSDFSMISNLYWLLYLPLPLMVAGYYWRSRRSRKNPMLVVHEADDENEEDLNEPDIEQAPPISAVDSTPASSSQDLDFFRSQLTPIEVELLEMLLKTTLAGKTTDIIAINKTIGVSNKETSLQKARRSICINNINNSFRQTMKHEDNLIIRERDADDKRAFVYRIDDRYLPLFSIS